MLHRLRSPRYLITLALVLLIIGAGYVAFAHQNGASKDTYTIERRDIIRTVRFSGDVEPRERIELNFDGTGRIAAVFVDVGETVKQGQTLARLTDNELQAQHAEAEADLKAARIELQKLRSGNRVQEIGQQEAAVASARADRAEARDELFTEITSSFQVIDSAIEGTADNYFRNVTTDPYLAVNIDVSEESISNHREELYDMMEEWRRERSRDAYTPDGDLNGYVSRIRPRLESARSFMAELADGFSDTTVGGITESDRTSIYNAWQEVRDAVRDLQSKHQALQTAQADLDEATEKLELLKEGSRREDIAAQEAQVEKARATLEKYNARILDTRITAPIDGVITKRHIEPGEQANPDTTALELMSSGDLEIRGTVPEVDIATIEEGATTTVTFDAFEAASSSGARITKIDPAETIIDNVPTYEVTLRPTAPIERLRPGMTANISLVTASRSGVPAIPTNMLKQRSGTTGTVVQQTADGTTRETQVQLGLRGDNGLIEITGGLTAGDMIVREP